MTDSATKHQSRRFSALRLFRRNSSARSFICPILIGSLLSASSLPPTETATASPSARHQSARLMHLAQTATVLCTRMDGRYLTRRVQTPEGCFDEVIDTYTGAVVSRKSAPCEAQC